LTASASIASSLLAHIALLVVLAPLGVLAIASASLLRGWLTWPLAAWFVKSTTGFNLGRQFAILFPPLAASLIMGSCVYAICELLSPQMPAVAALGLLIASGLVIYTAALWLLDPWVRKVLAAGTWLRRLRGGQE
jgi:xanthosine utilization system XapX-like protein